MLMGLNSRCIVPEVAHANLPILSNQPPEQAYSARRVLIRVPSSSTERSFPLLTPIPVTVDDEGTTVAGFPTHSRFELANYGTD